MLLQRDVRVDPLLMSEHGQQPHIESLSFPRQNATRPFAAKPAIFQVWGTKDPIAPVNTIAFSDVAMSRLLFISSSLSWLFL